MFHAICAAQFALHNLGAKVLLFFDICKENRRFLVESRKSKVESRKTKKATPKGRNVHLLFPSPSGEVRGGAYFLYFREGEARIFVSSQASAYQGNRLSPRDGGR